MHEWHQLEIWHHNFVNSVKNFPHLCSGGGPKGPHRSNILDTPVFHGNGPIVGHSLIGNKRHHTAMPFLFVIPHVHLFDRRVATPTFVGRPGVINFGDPVKMGTPRPHFHRYFGDPLVKVGTLLQLL